ncbi:MAG: hypothetical protein K5906_00625 [Bacilli bacterium]|nr:hypothetical protein [Bacilli bacterium]
MRHKLFITSIIFSTTTLLGGLGVFGAVSVTDNAGKLGIRIGIAELSSNTVTFKNADGSTFYSESVTEGYTLANQPGTPILSGYVFDGWTTDNETYNKTTDNLNTKTYSEATTYYPRFASYGYQVGSEAPIHLANKWDINNNETISGGSNIKLGTYIHNKSSLENATSAVTISNGGDYALVCGEDSSEWNSSKAGTLSNWSIEKYYTLTITNNWNSLKDGMYAHYFYDDTHTSDRKLTLVPGSTYEYYSYCPYNMTKVIYLALWADNNDSINNDWSNVKYKLPEITLASGTNSYELVDHTFTINYGTTNGQSVFLASNAHEDFAITTQYRLNWTNGNNWVGTFSFIKGTELSFKFVIAGTDSCSAIRWESDPNRTLTLNSTSSQTYSWK